MADLNIQAKVLNSDGSYSNLNPVSNANLIKTSDGSNVQAHIDNKNNPHEVTTAQIGAVPTSRTVNGKALSGNITLTATDVSAIPASQKGAVGGVATLNDNGYVMQCVGAGRKSGTPIGTSSTAEGDNTTASGRDSHAEGYNTTASGDYSHAEGSSTTASGRYSHAEGEDTTASGWGSHAEGYHTTASGYYSHAEGWGTIADGQTMHAMGTYNKPRGSLDAEFVIGCGSSGSPVNLFRVDNGGAVYGRVYNSSGADYSEFFEWIDENPNKEDRVGHFVTLDGEKIKYANDGDYIVGITSGSPAVIGDHPSESWSERWVKDVFGRIQYHTVDVPERTETRTNPDGTTETIVVQKGHQEVQPVVNPNYDPTKELEYKNREERPEWTTVGMLGKLVVIDDGTCTVNGYCKPKNGIATKADTGYRVMARLDETHIKVLMK